MLKKIALTAFAFFAVSFVAYAQLYNGFPRVGGASYCSSTGNNGVCENTVPSGPASVTGLEHVLADTGAASGQSPQTALMSMRALNAGPVAYTLCASGTCGSFTLGNGSGGILLAFSGTITSATVVMPAAPMDGQRVVIAADHTITTLTLTANTGQTFSVTAPTVLTASATVPQGYSFMYVASTTKWYRIY